MTHHRNGQGLTGTDKDIHGQTQTDTYRPGQTGTDRDRPGQTGTDRDRQGQEGTDRVGEGHTETRKDKLAGGNTGTNQAGTNQGQSGIIRKQG